MKIIYFGKGIRGATCLEAIINSGYTPLAVVAHYNSESAVIDDTVKLTAEKVGLPVLAPPNPNDPDFLSELAHLQPELMILSGYTKILKKDILKLPEKGTINLHGGRIPQYRGGSPINWQIINGEKIGGCAILYVDEGIDTGPVLAQQLYEIGPDETAGDIYQKTYKIFSPLLVEVLEKIERGTVKTWEQDLSQGVYYCKRYPRDGQIFWDRMTAQQVHNLVRSLNGPGLPPAFSYYGKQKITIRKTHLLKETIIGPPGRIALKREEGAIVICQDQGILVTDIGLEENVSSNPCLFFKLDGSGFCN